MRRPQAVQDGPGGADRGELNMKKRELTGEEAFDRAVKFSERYVAKGPYEFFPEPDVVRVVQEGLGENERVHGYRYCP